MITKEIHAAVDRMVGTVKTRLVNSIARAVIELVNDGTKMQSVQTSVLADETRDTERVQEYGFSSVPQPGAECVVLFPNGDRQNGMIIATDDRRYRPTGGQPGEVMVYTDEGDQVRLARGHVIVLATSGEIQAGSTAASDPVALSSELASLKVAIAGWSGGGTTDSGASLKAVFNLWSAPGSTKLKTE